MLQVLANAAWYIKNFVVYTLQGSDTDSANKYFVVC